MPLMGARWGTGEEGGRERERGGATCRSQDRNEQGEELERFGYVVGVWSHERKQNDLLAAGV